MSYDIRNKGTATSKRTAEIERLNFLALKSKLNKEYEDSQFQRKENERLEIEPAIPVYRSKDDLLADLTSQRQILKTHLASIMDNDNINKFIGFTFKNPDYALLANQYWDDIEPKVLQYKPMDATFLFEWLNRYFFTKQKMGTEIDTVIDPEEYGDLNDISKRASLFIAPDDLTDEQIKQSVREIMNEVYNFATDPYSNAKDDDIRKFYIQEKVIPQTKKLTPAHWRTIYEKEIRGFNDRVGSFLPHTSFSLSGYKKGSELAMPSAVIKPQQTTTAKAQVETGTFITPRLPGDKTGQEIPMPGGQPLGPPQPQPPIIQPQLPQFSDYERIIGQTASFVDFRDELYREYPNMPRGRAAYDGLRRLATSLGLHGAPQSAPKLFAFLKTQIGGGNNGNGHGKLQPGTDEPDAYEKEFGPHFGRPAIKPVSDDEYEPNEYEREFGPPMPPNTLPVKVFKGQGNFYKFGKYNINKRGLKKKH